MLRLAPLKAQRQATTQTEFDLCVHTLLLFLEEDFLDFFVFGSAVMLIPDITNKKSPRMICPKVREPEFSSNHFEMKLGTTQ